MLHRAICRALAGRWPSEPSSAGAPGSLRAVQRVGPPPRQSMAAHASPQHHLLADAYIGEVHVEGATSGPLQGLTAVVKDCFAVAGTHCSNGSPAWLATHPAAEQHAAAVQALLDAGVTIIGKNVMDEMAYSLTGENAHYGSPTNPAAPGRVTSGSSSGTAAAVAAGDAHIGLGGDTGGSVRVPAAHCGIYGFRPTHGRISLRGAVPLAPSFDTAGLFARDPAVLRRAGSVLFDPATRRPTALKRLLVATDAFQLADEATSRAVYDALAACIDQVTELLSKPQEVDVASTTGGLTDAWFAAFRVHQAFEVWQQHGKWVTQHRPSFGPGVKERFQAAAAITQQQFEDAAQQRAAARQRVAEVVGGDGVLLLPTAPGPPPLRGLSGDEVDRFRTSLICLTCIAGLSGFPQVNIPLKTGEGLPVGLGLLGPPGSDEDLMELTEQLAELLSNC